jgi:hypothetical protein
MQIWMAMALGSSIWRPRPRGVALVLTLAGIVGLASGCGRPNESSKDKPVEKSAIREPADSVATTPLVWSMQSNCGGCHTIEASSQRDGVHLASHHADVPCVACHQNESKLLAAHADMTKAPTKVGLDAPVENEVCFRCHTSWESLAKLTQDSQALVDTKDTVVNPHAIPQTASHNTNPYCFVCHVMHLDARPADEYCVGCHHKGVFECYTCHTSNDFVK